MTDDETSSDLWVNQKEFTCHLGPQPVVKFLKIFPEAVIPDYQTQGAAGLDLSSAVYIQINPGERHCVNTGLAIELPIGYEGQVRSRSGLALTLGLTVLNSPGTIDSDYRGQIKVILINFGAKVVNIKPGDRIAQLVIAPVAKINVLEVDELSETSRGSDGFGSTGG